MKDGLYKIDFRTPLGAGTGVVFAQAGRLWGGDAGMYYVGTFTNNNGQMEGNVKTGRHTNALGTDSVFGIDNVNINLRGNVNGDVVEATGTSPEARGVSFQVRMTRLTD